MNDIYIRDKFNKKVSSEVKKEILNIKFLTDFKLSDVNRDKTLIRNGFYKLKYIFGFSEESLDFLENIKNAIINFDSKKLINLCDSYEFRFLKIFDYINENVIFNCENLEDIYFLFVDLLKNGETTNSVNLSIFVLSFFSGSEIFDFCKNVLKDKLDYLEISSFLLKDYDDNSCTYFDLFKHLYRDGEIINILNKLNTLCFGSYKKFMVAFYLFDIMNFDFRNLNKRDFKIFFKYVFNCKKSLNLISCKFLFQDKFDEFKFMLNDLNFVLGKIKNIAQKEMLNYDDFENCFLNISLFEEFREKYLKKEFLEIAFERLIKGICDKNFVEVKQIVSIYNLIDFDVCEKLSQLFNENYASVEFCKFVLRAFRDYKYFDLILRELEKNVYLTKVVNDSEFRNVLLRSLTIIYKNFYGETVGGGFLNIIMNYEEFYNENNNYINFIVRKISERS